MKHTNVEIRFGVVDAASAPVTIQCLHPCSMESVWLSVSEWSGLDTGALFDAGSGSSGTASGAAPAQANAGALMTIDGPELLIFAVSDGGNISSQVTEGPWSALDRIPSAQLGGAGGVVSGRARGRDVHARGHGDQRLGRGDCGVQGRAGAVADGAGAGHLGVWPWTSVCLPSGNSTSMRCATLDSTEPRPNFGWSRTSPTANVWLAA